MKSLKIILRSNTANLSRADSREQLSSRLHMQLYDAFLHWIPVYTNVCIPIQAQVKK